MKGESTGKVRDKTDFNQSVTKLLYIRNSCLLHKGTDVCLISKRKDMRPNSEWYLMKILALINMDLDAINSTFHMYKVSA